MDKLPKVYKNNIDKEIRNNKDMYYGSGNRESVIDIDRKINELFRKNKYGYKLRVKIKYNNSEKIEDIILRKGNILININGEKINISEIKDIELIK